jgi:hypothetical protein
MRSLLTTAEPGANSFVRRISGETLLERGLGGTGWLGATLPAERLRRLDMGGAQSPASPPLSSRGGGGSEPPTGGVSRVGFTWLWLSLTVAAVVGVLAALAILVAVHHLFDVLGQGSLPSQDHTFQSAAAMGGLAAAITVAAILIAIGSVRHRNDTR